MCLEQEQQEHKSRSKNTNPKIKNLKITIFSNPAKSSNPKTPKYQINPKVQHNQSKQKILKLKKTHLKQVKPSKPTSSKSETHNNNEPNQLTNQPCNPKPT